MNVPYTFLEILGKILNYNASTLITNYETVSLLYSDFVMSPKMLYFLRFNQNELFYRKGNKTKTKKNLVIIKP